MKMSIEMFSGFQGATEAYDRIDSECPAATVSMLEHVATQPESWTHLRSFGGEEFKGKGDLAGLLGLGQFIRDVHVDGLANELRESQKKDKGKIKGAYRQIIGEMDIIKRPRPTRRAIRCSECEPSDLQAGVAWAAPEGEGVGPRRNYMAGRRREGCSGEKWREMCFSEEGKAEDRMIVKDKWLIEGGLVYMS
jgi:hypothetical protein